jgi:opacity protein-like surface antigen
MKKTVLSLFAGMVLLLGSSVAYGADIYGGSTKDSPTTPSYSEPATPVKWTGIWVGGALGAGWSNSEVNVDADFGEGENFNLLNFDGIGGFGLTYEAAIGGDIRIPGVGLLIGIEAGYLGSDITSEASLGGGELSAEFGLGDVYWAAARIGRTFANDRAMFYVKGGYAWNDPEDLEFTGGSAELSDREGFLAGAGIEAHLGSGLFLDAQYKHFFFDETTVASGEGIRVSEETDFGVATIGLKYKFGGGDNNSSSFWY